MLGAQKIQLDQEMSAETRGFFGKILRWFKRLFGGRRLRKAEQDRREKILRTEEKMNFLREVLGEKESLQEELILEKDSFYEKLHIRSKNEETEALEFAMERIRTISTLRKEEVTERMLARASEVFRQLTKGKYEKLILEENEELCIWDGSRRLKLFQVSTGCVDQVYLALRIALQDLFFGEEPLPLLFDDAFVYFDEKRLERLLFYLSGLKRQVLIFSCHKRELRILEKHRIPYGKILL